MRFIRHLFFRTKPMIIDVMFDVLVRPSSMAIPVLWVSPHNNNYQFFQRNSLLNVLCRLFTHSPIGLENDLLLNANNRFGSVYGCVTNMSTLSIDCNNFLEECFDETRVAQNIAVKRHLFIIYCKYSNVSDSTYVPLFSQNSGTDLSPLLLLDSIFS